MSNAKAPYKTNVDLSMTVLKLKKYARALGVCQSNNGKPKVKSVLFADIQARIIEFGQGLLPDWISLVDSGNSSMIWNQDRFHYSPYANRRELQMIGTNIGLVCANETTHSLKNKITTYYEMIKTLPTPKEAPLKLEEDVLPICNCSSNDCRESWPSVKMGKTYLGLVNRCVRDIIYEYVYQSNFNDVIVELRELSEIIKTQYRVTMFNYIPNCCNVKLAWALRIHKHGYALVRTKEVIHRTIIMHCLIDQRHQLSHDREIKGKWGGPNSDWKARCKLLDIHCKSDDKPSAKVKKVTAQIRRKRRCQIAKMPT